MTVFFAALFNAAPGTVRGQEELTAAQKQHNKQCTKRRARVEHPFA